MAKDPDARVPVVTGEPIPPDAEARNMSTPKLVTEAAKDVLGLVRTEIELVKAELKQNVRSEVQAAKGIGIAGVFALYGTTMLFVAAAFALAAVMPGWAAALIVAGVLLAVAGIAFAIGWKKHVRTPLGQVRHNLKENVE